MVADCLDDFWRWVLLDGNRNLLAGLISAGVFLACLGAVASGLLIVERAGPIRSILTAEIGGMVSFITIVVAIDQLILTQVFGTMGTFEKRLSEMREFRTKVEQDADLPVSPADPPTFLQKQLEAVLERTERLRNVRNASDRLASFTEDLARESERAHGRLDGATGSVFELVSVILDDDTGFMLHRIRELQTTGDLPGDSSEMLEDLESLLKNIHVTGLYFKTVFIQQELADLSKFLLYIGTVSLLYGGFMIVSYENVLAADPGRAVLTLAVCLALTLAFAPFAVLVAHVLRIATVARRTAADFGPFLLQRQVPDEAQ